MQWYRQSYPPFNAGTGLRLDGGGGGGGEEGAAGDRWRDD